MLEIIIQKTQTGTLFTQCYPKFHHLICILQTQLTVNQLKLSYIIKQSKSNAADICLSSLLVKPLDIEIMKVIVAKVMQHHPPPPKKKFT